MAIERRMKRVNNEGDEVGLIRCKCQRGSGWTTCLLLLAGY